MTVKTAPENSGLVRVQEINLKKKQYCNFFSGESDDDCKDCPRELWFGQSSMIKYQYHKFIPGERDDDCKDCPRELWFGQGSGIKSQKYINITKFFSGESDDDSKDCCRELWFGQGSVIKSQKCIHITFFLVKVTMTVKTAPENSGLVRVQVSNLKNISISQYSIW